MYSNIFSPGFSSAVDTFKKDVFRNRAFGSVEELNQFGLEEDAETEAAAAEKPSSDESKNSPAASSPSSKTTAADGEDEVSFQIRSSPS